MCIRDSTHALRGRPTPLGAAINAADTRFAEDRSTSDAAAAEQLRTIGQQVVEFATMRSTLNTSSDIGDGQTS